MIAAAGFVLIDPIFRALGARDTTLVLVGQYMRIWFIGTAVTVPTMFGNGMLIAAGDARTASRLMVSGTILNVGLDWIMIFGHFGFPAMGIAGAALATVIAQAVPTVWLLWRLGRVHHLLDRREIGFGRMATTIRPILRFAIPSILGMVLMPISGAIITRLVSAFGDPAVAGCGVAGRIEMFAFMVPMSLGMSLTPFVSQNFGAGRLDRLAEAPEDHDEIRDRLRDTDGPSSSSSPRPGSPPPSPTTPRSSASWSSTSASSRSATASWKSTATAASS